MNRWAIKKRLTGTVSMFATYGLLCVFGFVFAYPLVYMFLTSFMIPDDIFNPSVNFVPSAFSSVNYEVIFSRMNYARAIAYSTYISVVSSVLQALSCGLMGYAMSRFDFKLKKLYLIIVLISFIIPSQVTMIPTYLNYSEVKLIGSPLALFIPAALGQGFKAQIFILIFYSYFNKIPKALDEAAQIDGASPIKVFLRITAPLAAPAFVLTIIFSVVWYWNETYTTQLFIGDSAKTLLNQISLVLATLENEAIRDPIQAKINLPVRMATAFLCVIPLMLLYMAVQRRFVESVDQSGITGE